MRLRDLFLVRRYSQSDCRSLARSNTSGSGLTTPPSHRASNVSRRRLRLEVGLAILSVLLFFATLLWPEWIEIVFGVDPDFGNGSLEWLIMELTAISAVVAIFLARADWRRIRSPGLRQP